jgi:hypothetical protein
MKSQAMKSIFALIVLTLSTQAFAHDKGLCVVQEMGKDPSQNIMYKHLPAFSLDDSCNGDTCSGVLDYTSVLFPKVSAHVIVSKNGQVEITITDAGALNPVQGSKAYTAATAMGSGEVLASYNVTQGDAFPLASNAFFISCKAK